MSKRKTHDEFVTEMKEVNPNIEIIGKYTLSKNKVLCKCTICKHEWTPTANSLLKGTNCPKCNKRNMSVIMRKMRKSNDDFSKDLYALFPNIHSLDTYINNKTPIRLRCTICDTVWEARPDYLISGHGCPVCKKAKIKEELKKQGKSNVNSKSHDDFIVEMKEKHPEIEVLSTYTTNKEKVKCRCKICDNIWNMTPNALLSEQGCPSCNRKLGYEKHRLSNEEFLKRIEESNPSYKVLDEYVNYETKIRCKCDICNSIWSAAPIKLLNNRGCPICAGKKVVVGINDIATTRPDLIKYFANTEDSNKFTANSVQKVLLTCPDCGYKKKMSLNSLSQHGFSCKICSDNISYPNKYLRGFLFQLPVLNIDYEYFPDWVRPYRYDGYFEYKNNKYIIEMDGGLGHGNKKYNSNEKDTDGIRIDTLKDKLAYENNIQVIRIDCKYSDTIYISNNIKNSILNELFDLSAVDWNKCNEFATKNLVKEVCKYYNDTNDKIVNIASHFKLGDNTIRRYLKRGTEIGWCNYVPRKYVNKKILNEAQPNAM